MLTDPRMPRKDSYNVVHNSNSFRPSVHVGHYVLIREHNSIGNGVTIGSYTEIAHHCRIGDGVKVHSKCFICEAAIIKAGAQLGPGVVLVNDPYPGSNGKYRAAPVIGRKAIIGARCTIMPGVKIGDNAVVAPGSLVEIDVPDGEYWRGVPAKRVANTEDMDAYAGGHHG